MYLNSFSIFPHHIDLAMVVLDKCRKEADNGERDYNYEFIEDFPDLYMDDECPKFHSGNYYTQY